MMGIGRVWASTIFSVYTESIWASENDILHEFYPFNKDKIQLNLDSKAGLNHEQVGDVGGSPPSRG
jgi:hypothetical protein